MCDRFLSRHKGSHTSSSGKLQEWFGIERQVMGMVDRNKKRILVETEEHDRKRGTPDYLIAN